MKLNKELKDEIDRVKQGVDSDYNAGYLDGLRYALDVVKSQITILRASCEISPQIYSRYSSPVLEEIILIEGVELKREICAQLMSRVQINRINDKLHAELAILKDDNIGELCENCEDIL